MFSRMNKFVNDSIQSLCQSRKKPQTTIRASSQRTANTNVDVISRE